MNLLVPHTPGPELLDDSLLLAPFTHPPKDQIASPITVQIYACSEPEGNRPTSTKIYRIYEEQE